MRRARVKRREGTQSRANKMCADGEKKTTRVAYNLKINTSLLRPLCALTDDDDDDVDDAAAEWAEPHTLFNVCNLRKYFILMTI